MVRPPESGPPIGPAFMSRCGGRGGAPSRLPRADSSSSSSESESAATALPAHEFTRRTIMSLESEFAATALPARGPHCTERDYLHAPTCTVESAALLGDLTFHHEHFEQKGSRACCMACRLGKACMHRISVPT
jgi:hypothetical protein